MLFLILALFDFLVDLASTVADFLRIGRQTYETVEALGLVGAVPQGVTLAK